MADPTIDDIEALVGPATPHFALQLRARVEELIGDLPPEHEVRRHGEERMALLEQLAYASSKADEGEREPPTRPGWERLPSSAPVDEPLPRRP
jgi:hypothetical protein